MRLVLFEGPGAGRGTRPGVLTEAGVVDVSVRHRGVGGALAAASDGAHHRWFRRAAARLRPAGGQRLAFAAGGRAAAAALPRPGKILCCIGNYWEHAQREPRPLNMFLKNPDAVIGPGDTIVLPEFTDPYVFQHEAELASSSRAQPRTSSRTTGASRLRLHRHHRRLGPRPRAARPGARAAGWARASTPLPPSVPASRRPTRSRTPTGCG